MKMDWAMKMAYIMKMSQVKGHFKSIYASRNQEKGNRLF